MKSTMDSQGVITLSAENSLEAFALQRWVEMAIIRVDDKMRCENHHWRSTYLVINTTPPKDSE